MVAFWVGRSVYFAGLQGTCYKISPSVIPSARSRNASFKVQIGRFCRPPHQRHTTSYHHQLPAPQCPTYNANHEDRCNRCLLCRWRPGLRGTEVCTVHVWLSSGAQFLNPHMSCREHISRTYHSFHLVELLSYWPRRYRYLCQVHLSCRSDKIFRDQCLSSNLSASYGSTPLTLFSLHMLWAQTSSPHLAYPTLQRTQSGTHELSKRLLEEWLPSGGPNIISASW